MVSWALYTFVCFRNLEAPSLTLKQTREGPIGDALFGLAEEMKRKKILLAMDKEERRREVAEHAARSISMESRRIVEDLVRGFKFDI
jgi:hypothetical protein